jgi:ABC-type nitrate/sulfonate/bicarbonate transport system substrate-binding protein
MHLTFAHYRNRFTMYRTYYALAAGIVQPEGLEVSVIEVADPPSHEQLDLLLAGDVQAANLHLPSFLARRLDGAPIVGISTEWKSTGKGNGLFVLADGPIQTPRDLAGRRIAAHQAPHTVHTYLLKHRYGVDETRLRWEARPQQDLLGLLRSGQADAVVLIDQFFARGEQEPGVRCLYTDGEAWQALTGYPELIKHVIAVREPLLRDYPEVRARLVTAFRESVVYSEAHLPEIADEFLARYGGDREALLAAARFPKIEFTWTPTELGNTAAQMQMMVEISELPCGLPVAPFFVGE